MEQQQFIVLITKRLSNDITAEESTLLDAWLQESPDHRRLFDEYQDAWEVVPVDVVQTLQPDLDASYARLQKRIQPQPVPAMSVWSRPVWRVAAAVALLLAAVWGYQQWAHPGISMITDAAGDLEKKEILLPDGSKAWLRKGCTISYPATFSGDTRCVKVDGEAFFEVTYNADQHFCVELPHGEKVEVLGTSFCVKPDAGATIVAVESGKVRFTPDPAKTKDALVVAGKRAVYQKSTAQLSVSELPTKNAFAWQRGGLEFERTPLQQVIEDVEACYNVKIELKDPTLARCTYSSFFKQGGIDDILTGVCGALKMTYTNPSPNHYVLEGGTCL